MWILTEDNTMINTDNITYMGVEETDEDVYIKAYFTVASASSLFSDSLYTDNYKFCILDNTEINKNRVQDIFNEIYDKMFVCQKTFNIPKRLLGNK